MAMPVTRGIPTFGHSSAMAAGLSSQVSPPSVDRNSVERHGVPVPANMISGLSAVLHAVKHLLGDLHGVGRGRPATVEGHVGNHFADFLLRHPVVQGAP